MSKNDNPSLEDMGREAERRQDNLAADIDELIDRLNPKNAVVRWKNEVIGSLKGSSGKSTSRTVSARDYSAVGSIEGASATDSLERSPAAGSVDRPSASGSTKVFTAAGDGQGGGSLMVAAGGGVIGVVALTAGIILVATSEGGGDDQSARPVKHAKKQANKAKKHSQR